MKHFFLALVFAMCALVGLAQPRVTIGEPYPKIERESYAVTNYIPALKYFFSEGNNIVTVNFDIRNITVQTLDAGTLKLKTTKVYNDLPFFKKMVQSPGPFYKMELAVELKDHRYFFYSTNENDRYKLYCRELYFESATLSEPRLVVEYEQASKSLMNIVDLTSQEFIFSSDYSVILFKHDVLKNRKLNPGVVGLHVFRADMTELWQGIVAAPHGEMASECLVSNRGEVLMLGNYESDNDAAKHSADNGANMVYELHKITNPSTGFLQLSTFKLNAFIRSTRMIEKPNGSLSMVATYNRDGEGETVDGFIYFGLDSQGMPVDVRKHEIPFTLLKQNTSKKEQRKLDEKELEGNAENEHLKIVETIEDLDGNLLLIAEEQDTEYRSTAKMTYRYAIFRDLFIIQLSPAGDLLWMKKMAKEQQGGWVGSKGYHFMADEQYYYFLFADWPANKNLPDDEPPMAYGYGGDGVLSVFKVGRADGNVQRIQLADLNKANGVPISMFDMTALAIGRPDLIVIEFVTPNNKQNVLLKLEMDK